MLPELFYEWKLRCAQRSKRKLLEGYKRKRSMVPKGPGRHDALDKINSDEQYGSE
jgi:hypothetical protein